MGDLSFLLGAGVSLPAQIPTTAEITKYLLSGQGVQYSRAGKFVVQQAVGHNPTVQEVLTFLQLIKKSTTGFYQERGLNYEDLYYLAAQIRDFTTEDNNPVVSCFISELVAAQKQPQGSFSPAPMIRLAGLATNYIIDLLAFLLAKDTPKLDYLAVLKKAINAYGWQRVNFFSLNHDLVLERYFRQEEINYCDGFGRGEDRLRPWQPELFLTADRVNLLKLHGSVNWYHFSPLTATGQCRRDFFGCVGFLKDKKVVLGYNDITDRPLILTGRTNKILEYNRSIYVDLHYYFYRLLPRTELLIISGYSFGDRGINSWLINWLQSAANKRIVLLGPAPEQTIEQAPAGIRNNWPKWQAAARVVHYPAAIEAADWSEILSLV